VSVVADSSASLAAIFIWIFLLACFRAEFRFDRTVLAVALGWTLLVIASRGGFGRSLQSFLPNIFQIVFGLGLIAHLLFEIWKGRRGDLLERRRRLRIFVAVGMVGLLLLDLLADAVMGTAWRPEMFVAFQNGTILLVTALFSLSLLRAPAHPFGVRTPVRSEGNARQKELSRRLDTLMTEDKAYLDSALTFPDFARSMGATEAEVRALINQTYGYGHFRVFLNAYRTDYAKALLADADRASETILSIAYESGFASLPSFRRAFSRGETLSPSAWRAKALRRSG
jgi:AraC-like DNA-binding protein